MFRPRYDDKQPLGIISLHLHRIYRNGQTVAGRNVDAVNRLLMSHDRSEFRLIPDPYVYVMGSNLALSFGLYQILSTTWAFSTAGGDIQGLGGDGLASSFTRN